MVISVIRKERLLLEKQGCCRKSHGSRSDRVLAGPSGTAILLWRAPQGRDGRAQQAYAQAS